MKFKRLEEPDYWITTFAVALFGLAFLIGLAIAQVMS